MTDRQDVSDCPMEVLPEVPPAAAARLRQLLDGLKRAQGKPVVTDFRGRLHEWLAVATEISSPTPSGATARAPR